MRGTRRPPSQQPRLQRLVVLGAGAVGGSIGGLLSEAGLPVQLVARGEHAAALRRDGLTVALPERSLRVMLPCAARVTDITWRAGDAALLATKLQDAESILDELLAAAGPGVPVICAVNGIHGERFAAARFESVLSMLVWLPATHLVPGEVRLHSAGTLGVLDTGPTCGEHSADLAEHLCARLRDAGFDAIARDDIARWKHAKWITNLGGAAQALVTDDWQRVAAAARAEGEAVLDAAGIERVATADLLQRVRAVRDAPIDGEPRAGGSTWQSRARGKPLESRWLEGAMAELAAEVGTTAPINAFLARVADAPRALTAAEVLGR